MSTEKRALGLMERGVGTEEAKALNEGSRVMKQNLQLSQQGLSVWGRRGPD